MSKELEKEGGAARSAAQGRPKIHLVRGGLRKWKGPDIRLVNGWIEKVKRLDIPWLRGGLRT